MDRSSNRFGFTLNLGIGTLVLDPAYTSAPLYARPLLRIDAHADLGGRPLVEQTEDVDNVQTSQARWQFSVDGSYGAFLRDLDLGTTQQFFRLALGPSYTRFFYRESYGVRSSRIQAAMSWAPGEPTRLYPELNWTEEFLVDKTNGLHFNYQLSLLTCVDTERGFCGFGGQALFGFGFDLYTSAAH